MPGSSSPPPPSQAANAQKRMRAAIGASGYLFAQPCGACLEVRGIRGMGWHLLGENCNASANCGLPGLVAGGLHALTGRVREEHGVAAVVEERLHLHGDGQLSVRRNRSRERELVVGGVLDLPPC